MHWIAYGACQERQSMQQQRPGPVTYVHACALLGVPSGADEAAIKRAFRLAALRDHPDVNRDADAAERFRRLHLAYRIALAGASLPPVTAPSPAPSSPIRTTERRGRPERLVPTWAFVGLHATGLLFGLSLATSVLVAIGAGQLDRVGIFLLIPGLVILPDSWSGIYPYLKAGWQRLSVHRKAQGHRSRTGRNASGQ